MWVKSNSFYSQGKWMMHCENEKGFPRGMKQKGMNLAEDRNTEAAPGCACCVPVLWDRVMLVGSTTAPGSFL